MKDLEAKKAVLKDLMDWCEEQEMSPLAERHKAKLAASKVEDSEEFEEPEPKEELDEETKQKLMELYASLK